MADLVGHHFDEVLVNQPVRPFGRGSGTRGRDGRREGGILGGLKGVGAGHGLPAPPLATTEASGRTGREAPAQSSPRRCGGDCTMNSLNPMSAS